MNFNRILLLSAGLFFPLSEVSAGDVVPVGTQRLRVERPAGTKVVLCLHPTGHHSVLAAPPIKNKMPVLLFTNRQK